MECWSVGLEKKTHYSITPVLHLFKRIDLNAGQPNPSGTISETMMRAVVQRVKSAKVDIEGKTVGKIGPGLLIFLGVGEGDSEKDADYLANKIAHLRIFPDAQGLMNLSAAETDGEALVVSQFTLWGDCRKGRRPSFTRAARPETARALYEYFIGVLRGIGLRTQSGQFQEMMDVHSINDGPVTMLMDSAKVF